MSDDLIKRLRSKTCCDENRCNCDEAADRIEALMERIEAARVRDAEARELLEYPDTITMPEWAKRQRAWLATELPDPAEEGGENG